LTQAELPQNEAEHDDPDIPHPYCRVAFLAGLVIFLGVFMFATGQLGTGGAGGGPSAIGGPFNLTDQNGKPITDQELKGRPFLVFFGYTHCPDVCPDDDVRRVGNDARVGPDADKTAAVFITVDPERDTAPVIKDYLSSFDPHLRGATGDLRRSSRPSAPIASTPRKFPPKKATTHGPHRFGLSDDKQGRFVAPFSFKRRPEDSAADLRRYF